MGTSLPLGPARPDISPKDGYPLKKLVDTLASLKLAVVLLVVLLVGLSAGTILESRTDAATAGQLVYYSWWFLGLQGLFAVNVACSIANLFPWGRKRIGFVMTHASLLLIFAGAALTYFGKVEGQLGLWEGESGAVAVERDPQGKVVAQHELPFSVKLDDFVLETYQGTMRPSGFASQVVVTDTRHREELPGEDLDEHAAPPPRVVALPVELPAGRRARGDGPLGLEGPRAARRLRRLRDARPRDDHRPPDARLSEARARGVRGEGRRGRDVASDDDALAPPRARAPAARRVRAGRRAREHRVDEAAPGPARRAGHAARHARPRDGLERDGVPFLERRGPGRDVHGVALRPAVRREGARREGGQQGARRCGGARPLGEARLLRAARRECAAHAARPGGGPGGLAGQAPHRCPQGRREARAPPDLPLRRPPAPGRPAGPRRRATRRPAGTCPWRSRPRRSSPTRTALDCRAGRPRRRSTGRSSTTASTRRGSRGSSSSPRSSSRSRRG